MRGGFHDFPSKCFSFTLLKTFIVNSSVFQKSSGSGKKCMERDGDITFFRHIFSVSQFRKLTLGTPRCFTKLMAAKILYGCEWDITFFRGLFLDHSTENFHWELFGVSELFRYEKKCMDKTGGIAKFRQTFCLISPKNYIGKPSVFQKTSDSENILSMRRGLSRFPVKFFSLTVPKKFIAKSLLFQENSEREEFLWMRGGILCFSVEFFLSQITENFHWELFGVSKKFLQWKVCMDERRGYHNFCQKFCSMTVSRFSFENSSSLQKNSGSETNFWMRGG